VYANANFRRNISSKYKNGHLLVDSRSIVNTWKKYTAKLLNIYTAGEFREPKSSSNETAIEKL